MIAQDRVSVRGSRELSALVSDQETVSQADNVWGGNDSAKATAQPVSRFSVNKIISARCPYWCGRVGM
jgi:hypothetical protein